MQTFKRICIKDYVVADDEARVLKLNRGQEYLTSKEEDDNGERVVTVFTPWWVRVPVDIFAGEKEFTPETSCNKEPASQSGLIKGLNLAIKIAREVESNPSRNRYDNCFYAGCQAVRDALYKAIQAKEIGNG